jgi:hypothetical protein
MAIGGIVFSLTAGIRCVIFRRATLVIGIILFRHATLVIHGIFICHTTTAMHGGHNNQPKEGCAMKMPATEAKQQATTSQHNERTRGWQNTNTSATTAMGTMTMVMVTAASMTTMK